MVNHEMNLSEIKAKLHSKEYDFLRNNEHLGNHIVLLGLGGSYSYGTNNENSDLDIRGIATNCKRDILIGNNFEQITNTETDTTIYSFNKAVQLFCSCNPNTIELLGLKPEHYLYISPIGREILDNKKMFLSKRVIYTFGGYANAQLRRLENKSARLVSQSDMERHILDSIEHASIELKSRYFSMPDDAIKLYIDKTSRDGYDTEIFTDISLKHYPLRDFKDFCSDMNAVIKSYSKIGKRNEHAIEHEKLGKHMMHLVRLYLMCFDILEYGEINTYREKEHDFLMAIRNGRFLDENRQPTNEFYTIVDKLQSRLDYLREHTNLPDNVNMKEINDFKASINGRVFCEMS